MSHTKDSASWKLADTTYVYAWIETNKFIAVAIPNTDTIYVYTRIEIQVIPEIAAPNADTIYVYARIEMKKHVLKILKRYIIYA